MEKLHGTLDEQLHEIDHIKKVRELAEKLKDIKIAMLSTVSADNKQHSRPMYTFPLQDDGIIWMLASKDSRTAEEIRLNGNILLNYSNPQHDLYITINARAEISEDHSKIEELWTDRFKMYFPYGKSDPTICLLKITPLEAEYWDTPDLLLAQIISLVKNTMGGNPYVDTENKKLEF